jgi:hypothetical protein
MNERTRLIKEMQKMEDCLRSAGVQFVVVLLDGKNIHKISTEINARDDHHFLDMMFAVFQNWRAANHK